MDNIITANLAHGRTYVTASRYMEDYGQVLKIEGVELPTSYQVDFSNHLTGGDSVTMLGNADGVAIPTQFFDTGKDVYAFLYMVGDSWGRTTAIIRIPNKRRPHRTDATPTPEQQSVIDQTIAALNNAVEATAADAEQTGRDAEATARDAERAEQARDQSVTAKDTAVEAAGDAGRYASAAEQSAEAANLDKQDADRYARAAGISAERAEQAANTAGWVDFYIDDEGYLHYVKADSVGLDFYVDAEGYLHVVMED